MIYKIISTLFLLVISILVGIYFLSPELYDTKNVFYDRFYTGSELLTRIEDREIAQFPKTIGRLALNGPTDYGVGIRIDRECRFSDPAICSKMYRLEYKDFKGDTYFVNISKFKLGISREEVNQLFKKVSSSVDGNFYRIEKHEIAWVSSQKDSFIIIQKGVCSIISSCNYPTKIDKADVVVSTFTSIFPIDEIKK